MQLPLPLHLCSAQLGAIGCVKSDTSDVERHNIPTMRHWHDTEAGSERFQSPPAPVVLARDFPLCPVALWNVVAHQIGKINIRTVVNIPHLLAHDAVGIE